jgi:ribosomal-protein-alanine N-acetyltransferase
MQHPFIIGERIYLRGLERNDLTGNMFQWANDPEVTHYMFMGATPNTMERLQEEYEQLHGSKNDVIFAIVEREADTHIGNVGLYTINWIARSAELRIVVGEKQHWNKGYGTEATRLTLRYGFDKLNLNKVWLGVNAAHQGAVRAYEKAGFVHEGVLRQEIYRNGQYYDAARMSVLRGEFLTQREQK